VLKHIRECTTCQQNKSEQTHPAGLLQPLPIPEQKWESISMDFITGLPRVQGRDCIFVVVDRLTKFAHFFAIPTDYKAIQVAELFFREVFRLHGLPRQIVSDRDGRFIIFLAGAFQIGRHRVSYEYQLPPTDRWEDRDRQQMGGRVSEELCGGTTTHLGEMVTYG
jgi:hypothetical protein